MTAPATDVMPLNTHQLAWAAGFLEGEGWFAFPSHSLAIRVNQKIIEPLIKLLQMFGGSVLYNKQGNIWFWAVYGQRAAGVMMTLYSMLSARRKAQIVSALDEWRTR